MSEQTKQGAPAIARPRRELADLLGSKQVKDAFSAVATRYLPPERMVRICVSALNRTPKLGLCDPVTVLGSMMFLASIGLEPNTPLGHAYLIPFDKKRKNPETNRWEVAETHCNLIIGYKGFVQMAYREPRIKKFTADAIHAKDVFEYQEGSDAFLKFSMSLQNDRGPLIGAFAFARVGGENGDIDVPVVLPLGEIWKRRDRSETYRSAVAAVERARDGYERTRAEKNLAETPWVLWEDTMAMKSALLVMARQRIPLGGALATAAAIDESADGGKVEWAKFADVDFSRSVASGEQTAITDQSGDDERSHQIDEANGSEEASGEAQQTRKRGWPAGRPRKTAAQASDQETGQTEPAKDAPAAAGGFDPATGEVDDLKETRQQETRNPSALFDEDAE